MNTDGMGGLNSTQRRQAVMVQELTRISQIDAKPDGCQIPWMNGATGRAGSPLPAAIANQRIQVHRDGAHGVGMFSPHD